MSTVEVVVDVDGAEVDVVDEVVEPEMVVVLDGATGEVVVVEAGLAQAARITLSKTAKNEVLITGL